MAIREISSGQTVQLQSAAATAIAAEVATEQSDIKSAKKRVKHKILSLHAPTIANKAPSAKPAAPIPTPPVPVLAVFSDSTSQLKEEEQREQALNQLWSTLQTNIEEFHRLQAATSQTTAAPATPPPAPIFTPAQQKQVTSMANYMLAILLASIALASDESTVSKQTNSLSDDMVTLTQQQATQAVKELNEYLAAQKEQEEESHESFWEKVGHAFESIGHLFQAIDPLPAIALFLEGDIGDIKKKMDDQFNEHWTGFKRDLALSGEAFQEIVCMMMILGGAMSGNVGLAMMGFMMLTMSVSGGQNDLNNLIAALAKKIGGGLATQLILEVAVALALAVLCGGTSSLLSKAAMTAGMTNVYSDTVKGVIEIINAIPGSRKTGEDTEEQAAEIGGAILGMVAMFGAAGLESGVEGAESTWAQKAKDLLGETKFLAVTRFLKTFTSLMALLAAGQSIQTGLNFLKQAGILDEMGDTMSAQAIYGDLLQVVNSIISANTDTANAIHGDYAAVNSRWDSIFVSPWNA